MRNLFRETERQVERAILDAITSIPGVKAWKNESVGVYDPVKKTFRRSHNPYRIRGVPDILGWYRDRFFGIEVKTPTNHNGATYEQRQWIKEANSAGHFATVIISVDEALQFIERVKHGDRLDNGAYRFKL